MRLESWQDVHDALNTPSLHVANADIDDPESLAGIAARLLVSRKNGSNWREVRTVIEEEVASIDLNVLSTIATESVHRAKALDIDWRFAVGPLSLGKLVGFDESAADRIALLVDRLARALAGEIPEEEGIQTIRDLEATLNALDPHRTRARLSLLMNSRIGLFLLLTECEQHSSAGDGRSSIRRILHESPPVKEIHRVATEDVTIGSHAISTGTHLDLSLASAVRQAPEQPNLAFGGGHRMCPAQTLAMTIGAAVLDAVRETGM